MAKEFVLWGTKDGVEDVITVNGKEVQTSLLHSKKIKKILLNRKTFDSIRIQTITHDSYDMKSEFTQTLKNGDD